MRNIEMVTKEEWEAEWKIKCLKIIGAMVLQFGIVLANSTTPIPPQSHSVHN